MIETIGEMKRHLKVLGLKVSGNRKECEQRLADYYGKPHPNWGTTE